MDAYDHTLIWDWCRRHGLPLSGDGSDDPQVAIELADDDTLEHRVRAFYADGQKSGREPGAAAATVAALGAWDECLVWLTEWGVWESGEDWPRFYAWRGAHGERRSLAAAPGHRFRADQAADLEGMLTQVMENAWDATLLPVRAGAKADRRIRISHDEWIEVRSREPVAFAVPPA